MEKTLMIGGKEVHMRASALVPRLYRFKFGRDMVADMNRLRRSFEKAQKAANGGSDEEVENAQLSSLDLTIFENVSYIMIKHAGDDIPDSPDEWLDTIDGVFSIYEVLPQILELWNLNLVTTSTQKKN